jgi:predicted Zn-dependent protease
MKPEEYLDRLIEIREHGLEPPPAANDEIAAGLAAAQALARLNEIDIPPDFASKLELSVRLRARELAHQNDRSLSTTRPLRISRPLRPTRPLRQQRPQPRRAWIAALGIAAMLALACFGILTVSAQSLPGDPFYGLKQAAEQFKINFASSAQDRISAQIDQVHSTLADLNTVVNNRRGDDAINVALNTLNDKTKSAQAAVAALPAGTNRDSAQSNLNSVLSEEDQTLRHLIQQVDWSTRLAFTRQLGALGDAIPTVTRVTILVQSNRTLLITLTGTYFAPGARLVIDGQPAGIVTGNTQVQLTAVLSNTTGLFGQHEIGVLNPDGTAAQITYRKDTENDQPDDNHPRYGTPQPTRSPGGDSGE